MTTEQPSTPEQIPSEVLQTLAVRWMESFEAAARSQSRESVMKLFSPVALICGAQKDGPLDHILSKNFHFEVPNSKMVPRSPSILVVVQWHSVSEIHGGPTRKGDATLYLEVIPTKDNKRMFVCHHAHFSLC